MLRSEERLSRHRESLASRRLFLQQIMTGTAAATAVGAWPGLHGRAEEPAPAAGAHLLVRSQTPFNAEPPLGHLLDHWLTGSGEFFKRNHGTIPKLEIDGYRLTVEGLVEKPLQLSLGELKERFPEVFAAVTLTCAGNRRNEFPAEKKIAGVQWDAGAVSNAEWRGVNLADVLKFAGLKAEAKHVWFEGRDEIAEGGQTIPFGGSIPLEKALSATRYTAGAMLVHTMNQRPLPVEHGAPLRGIVPGYIGARSVKWLGKIVVSDRPSPNHFLAKAYKVLTQGTPEETQATGPIYESVINSAICRWSPSADKSQLLVQGFALPSGQPDCLIRQVDVSLDGGATWTAARLTSPQREYCWAFWSAELPAAAAGKTALVKATDSRGETQPREMAFNLKGYQYNAWHRVELKS